MMQQQLTAPVRCASRQIGLLQSCEARASEAHYCRHACQLHNTGVGVGKAVKEGVEAGQGSG